MFNFRKSLKECWIPWCSVFERTLKHSWERMGTYLERIWKNLGYTWCSIFERNVRIRVLFLKEFEKSWGPLSFCFRKFFKRIVMAFYFRKNLADPWCIVFERILKESWRPMFYFWKNVADPWCFIPKES